MEKSRIDKIKKWLKDPYNLALVGILVFAFCLRLYYFILTKNQPLWWDEAEYMLKAKSIFKNTPTTGYFFGRPPLMSFLFSIFFLMPNGELLSRIAILALSIFSIYLLYKIGETLFSKITALFSAYFFSISWIFLFLNFRLLTETLAIFFALLSIYLFLKFQTEKKAFYLILSIGFLVFTVLAKWTGIILIPIYCIQILITDVSKFLKKLAIGLLIIQAILGITFLFYGNIPILNTKIVTFSKLLPSIFTQLKFLKEFYGFESFLIIGIFFYFSYYIGIRYDTISKNKNLNSTFFILNFIIINLAGFTFIMAWENRYLLFMIIPISLLLGQFVFLISKKISKNQLKVLIAILILALLFHYTYYQLEEGNSLIKIKLHTYEEVKKAGLWLKTHTTPFEVIATSSVPQITYYAERVTISLPKENISNYLDTNNVSYIFITGWETTPQKFLNWLQVQNLSATKIFYRNNKPIGIIYRYR